jgi:hypothetical protein
MQPGCCREREDPPNYVYLSDQAAEDLARVCRISNSETELEALNNALGNYVGDELMKRRKPGEKRLCVDAIGTVCEQSYECDKGRPDLGDIKKNCPLRDLGATPLPPPRDHYVPCLPGCGGPARIPERNLFFLDPEYLPKLDQAMQFAGTSSRQRALHVAILHYEQVWLRWRQEPGFYQYRPNLPETRKPDSPCPFAEPGRY